MALSIAQGQCSTCKHVAYCSLLDDPERPAVICDRFEEFYSVSSDTFGWMAGENAGLNNPGKKTESGSADYKLNKGLCSDCENNRKCIFPKTEAGKWHCEEYR